MTDIWDTPELKIATDYIRFEEPGDSVVGEVLDIRIHHWNDGTTSPQLLLLVDGEEKSLTAGQYQLKAKLAELRPQVGDTIRVVFDGIEKRAGGKTLKLFSLDVKRASGVSLGGVPATATPAPAAAPAAPAADPLAGLTEEQKAAVLALGKPVDNANPPF
jgi:hypothetical protein